MRKKKVKHIKNIIFFKAKNFKSLNIRIAKIKA